MSLAYKQYVHFGEHDFSLPFQNDVGLLGVSVVPERIFAVVLEQA